MINRRDFLKGSGLLISTMWLGGCGLRAAVPDVGVVASVRDKAVRDYLHDFAALTGSDRIAASLVGWRDQLDQPMQAKVDEVNAVMAEHGFVDYTWSEVYTWGDVLFYGVDNADGLNACAPFFTRSSLGAVIEGPLLTGLSVAASLWQTPRGIRPAAGLIPRTGQLTPSQFAYDMESPFIAQTMAGQLSMHYHAVDPARKTGRLDLIATTHEGHELMNQVIQIEFA